MKTRKRRCGLLSRRAYRAYALYGEIRPPAGGFTYTHPAPRPIYVTDRGSVQKLVAEIMVAWRRAERLASTLPPASPEHEAAERACFRLRDAYQELTHSGVAEALSAAEAKLLLQDAASDIDMDPRPAP